MLFFSQNLFLNTPLSLSEFQKAKIVTLHDEGLSEPQIVIKIKVIKTAVHQAINKFRLLLQGPEEKRKPQKEKYSRRQPIQTDSHKIANEFCQKNSGCNSGQERWSDMTV